MNSFNISRLRNGCAAVTLGLCLALAGPAQAAKFIQTGTIVADSNGTFSFPLNFASPGSATRGKVQFITNVPVTSHVEMTILQSLYTQTSHGFTFIGSSTITGSSDVATTTSYSSQFGLGGWPYHLHIKHLIAYYSGGVAKLVSKTTPGASVAYQLRTAGVPEPSTWALMILGLGSTGAAMRRKARLGWKHRELKPAR